MGYLTELLLNETSIEDLRTQWVDSKKMSPEQFDTICKAANNKSSWVTWFGRRILDRQLSLKSEDITKWQEIINLFERYKQRFIYKDINQVKTRDQISQFVDQALDLKSQAQSKDVATKAAKDQFAEFYRGSVEVDGKTFKVYVLPKGRTDLYDVSRALAGDTHWCTASSDPQYFKYYIDTGDLFIMVNAADPKEKYQLHSRGDFMDRTDTPVSGELRQKFLKALFPENELILYQDLSLEQVIKKLKDLGWIYYTLKNPVDSVEKVDLSRYGLGFNDLYHYKLDANKFLCKIFNKPFDTEVTVISDLYKSKDKLGRYNSEFTYFLDTKKEKAVIFSWDRFSMADVPEYISFDLAKDTGNAINVWFDQDNGEVKNFVGKEVCDLFLVFPVKLKGKSKYKRSQWSADNLKLNESFNPDQKARLQYLAGILK